MNPSRTLWIALLGLSALAFTTGCKKDPTLDGAGGACSGNSASSSSGTGGSANSSSSSSSSDSTTAVSSSSSSSSSSSGAGNSPWRSVLYPADWTPSFTAENGNFLHDFSYAGYHNGETPPGAPAGTQVLNVVADLPINLKADPSGTKDCTDSVNAAIGQLPSAGGVVLFPEGKYRFDKALLILRSNIVLRGAGSDKTKLFFTNTQGMSYNSHVQFAGKHPSKLDLEVPLSADGVSRASYVEVADPVDLAPGDDIDIGWVISEGFRLEHSMEGIWGPFNDKWQPFFRRTVVSIDKSSSPAHVFLDVPLRYPAKKSNKASIRRRSGYLSECGVESLSISNAVAWADAWSVDQVHALGFADVKDCWVKDVDSFSSTSAPTMGPGVGAHLQSGGIVIIDSKRMTVANVNFGLAERRDGGNGYLFETQRSNEILIRDSIGDGGRHNFINNWGFGTTGCVWLRVQSRNGMFGNLEGEASGPSLSDFHHSLATANLIDESTFDDGISILNRLCASGGGGQTGTENVMWNLDGNGKLISLQYKMGYVIGTTGLTVDTNPDQTWGVWTLPADFTEGIGQGATLTPASLYEDQLAKRLTPP